MGCDYEIIDRANINTPYSKTLMAYTLSDGGAYVHTFTTSIANNNWYHIVINMNSDLSSATVYSNNTFISTQIGTAVNISFNTFYLCNDSGNLAGAVLNGCMDAVGIWERNLTSSEIDELYNASSPYYSN